MRIGLVPPCMGLLTATALAVPPGAATETDGREYKLMLVASRFAGPDPEDTIRQFWTGELVPLVARSLDPEGDRDEIDSEDLELDEERLVRFYDTPGCDLRKAGFILRVRVDAPKGVPSDDEPTATLKFRSPDPAIAAESRLSGDDPKFEADISPVIATGRLEDGQEFAVVNRSAVMRIQYSRSTKQDIVDDDQPGRIGDLYDLFDGLRGRLDGLDEATALALVSGFTAFERVYDVAEIDLGRKVDAEVGVTLWYDHDGGLLDRPVVAELSFKFEMPDPDQLDPDVPRRALALFEGLQSLGGWFDPGSDTKTAFAYGVADFCRTS
jgi:hypothetical protein